MTNNHNLPSQSSTLVDLPVTASEKVAHKGILVLPFNVASLDESQQWLRYGAMEGLIKRISPNKDITVFHLEDAIEILNRVTLGERENIDKIFAKSGAFYILQTSLSGQPGELNVCLQYLYQNKPNHKNCASDQPRALTHVIGRYIRRNYRQ